MRPLLFYNVATIVWLPAKNEIPAEYMQAASGIDHGCFDHPAIILWIDPTGTEAMILMMTSFGGQDLQRRHPNSDRMRSHYLPVHPSSPHPDNGSLLYLREDALLSRNSYIITAPRRTIKAALLRPYKGQTCVLRADPFDKLKEYINFRVPPASFISNAVCQLCLVGFDL
ncbi:hypothetical protein DM02DRAFT_539458 [Periconia macrospinosa]|uniref:Uncharacterized protein n=1 Tax=Periconia macrospinosa TaxID=97972 RepID=A0A2V1DA79_9PLEO|nr:hypothetical protein DM02DRAFT_539458 [Periconia macrospinosa]